MIDRNEIPFNPLNAVENGDGIPPSNGLDRYSKKELIEFGHQWCDITEEKVARIRAHLNSNTVSAEQALWYARIFGKYAGLLPTGPARLSAAPQGKPETVDLEALLKPVPMKWNLDDTEHRAWNAAVKHIAQNYNITRKMK